MKTAFLILLLLSFSLVALTPGAAISAEPKAVSSTANAAKTSKAEAVVNLPILGETEVAATYEKLKTLPLADVREFVGAAKAWTGVKDSRRANVMHAFDVLRRRSDVDAALALEMLKVAETNPRPKTRVAKEDVFAVAQERRVILFLSAKAGRLSVARVEQELTLLEDTSIASTLRLAQLGALTDAMGEAKLRPTVGQLERLLKNDVLEIRSHAVDWFRVDTPKGAAEKTHFIKQALATKPVQVRERAYRTIASWSKAEITALKTDAAVAGSLQTCAKDSSDAIRSACEEIRAKVAAP